MYSRLKEIVKDIASRKNVATTSFQEDRIRSIERKLDNSEISIEDALNLLEAEFGYHFGKDDYSEIKKKLEGR